MSEHYDALKLAKQFHSAHREMASTFKTRPIKPWNDTPENIQNLMIAICVRIMSEIILPTESQALTEQMEMHCRVACEWCNGGVPDYSTEVSPNDNSLAGRFYVHSKKGLPKHWVKCAASAIREANK